MRYLLALFLFISIDVAAAQNWTRPMIEGGTLVKRSINLTNTAFDIKLTKGQLYGYFIHNGSASVRYIKLYESPAPGVTVGTTPPKMVLPLPAGASAHLTVDPGIAFANGIAAACVTGVDDGNVGAPGANECVGNFFYR